MSTNFKIFLVIVAGGPVTAARDMVAAVGYSAI